MLKKVCIIKKLNLKMIQIILMSFNRLVHIKVYWCKVLIQKLRKNVKGAKHNAFKEKYQPKE
ncbi:hypothetical protein AZH47_09460 [Corynebacterium striatum]|nr:hypothetical protein AZH47_09460 [Corynebacterium striatum]